MNNEPILVLHVKEGYDERARHIEQMMERRQLSFEYVLDGDIADLTPDIINQTFRDIMLTASPALQSCSYKHLCAYRRILDNGWPGALILEDDICLKSNFKDIYQRSLAELAGYDPAEPIIVSYDATRLRFVPYSQRRKGRLLYDGPHDRLGGAYYINAAACRMILDTVACEGMPLPIDTYHTHLLRTTLLRYLWCQPAPAMQGSFNGLFGSSLSVRHRSLGAATLRRAALWQLKAAWRRLLYRLR